MVSKSQFHLWMQECPTRKFPQADDDDDDDDDDVDVALNSEESGRVPMK